jgi:hypothetical protein
VDELDYGGFVGNYPLWTWVGRENPRILMCRGNLNAQDQFVGIFTDDDLAGRFITELKIEQQAIKLKIANAPEFLIFLGGALLAGTTHLVFDPSSKGGTSRYTGPIAQIVETLGKQLRPTPVKSH